MEKKFYRALTIVERINILKKADIELKTDKMFLDKWTNIKGLTSIADTQKLCELTGITLEEFTYAIKPFDLYEEELLEEGVKQTTWYIKFLEIMEFFRADNVKLDELNGNICYVLRPFIKYFIFKIGDFINLNTVKITENCMKGIVDWISGMLSNIAAKIITLDLHFTKEKYPDITFENYLSKYNSSDQLEEFYSQYPVMVRLLTERTLMMTENTICIFRAVIDNEVEVSQLSKTDEIVFDKISFGEGDTHSKGKSVSVIQFVDGKKILYKPKCLRVEKYFNDFIEFMNKIKTDELLDFKFCRSIWKDEYTLCEFIEVEPCENKEEVSQYYERVGQILFLMYIFNGTDFHYENIISSKGYPYLVDIETLFQVANYDILPSDDTPELAITKDSVTSVLSVGILPLLGFNQNPEGKSVDISALNGDEQRLPFKILQLKNANTADMIYEYDYTEIKGASNIPFIGKEKQSFSDYSESFIKGFGNMAQFVLSNKDKIISKMNECFTKEPLFVRQLTKATASYATLMSYSNHPNYLADMMYMEKLYENLMSYPYSDKRIVPAEIHDMLNGDIPIFFSQLCRKDIYSSGFNPIADYFRQTPLERALEKVDGLNETDIKKQLNLLLSSIGETRKKRIEWLNNVSDENISDTVIDKSIVKSFVMEITNLILDKRIFNCKKNEFTWIKYSDAVRQLEPIDFSFGIGLAGLARYFEEIPNVIDIDCLSDVRDAILKKVDSLPLKYFETNFDNLDSLICFVNSEKLKNKYVDFVSGIGRRYLDGNIHLNERQLLTYIVLLAEYSRGVNSPEIMRLSNVFFDEKSNLYSSLSVEEKLFCGFFFEEGTIEEVESYANGIMAVSAYQRWKMYRLDCYSDGVGYIVNNLIDIYRISGTKKYLYYARQLMSIVYHAYQKHGNFRIMSDIHDCDISLFTGIAGIAYTFARTFLNTALPNIFCLKNEPFQTKENSLSLQR